MDYLYECLTESMPKTGSIYYYAYRQCDAETTKILYALDQLKYQWLRASELYYEPYPSLQKLQWWQQSLTNIETHRNHPLIDTLCKHFTFEDLYAPLQQDLQYALTTITEGRNYQANLDLSQSFLGIAILKAKVLGFEDIKTIEAINHVDELLRHILMIGKHFSRNIHLHEELRPSVDQRTFCLIIQSLLAPAQIMISQLNLPYKQVKPLILLHKQQNLCVKKFVQKIDNPFTQSIRISPLALLFSTLCTSKL